MPNINKKNLRLFYLKRILLEYTDDENGLTINEIIEKMSAHGITVTAQTLRNDMALLRYDKLDVLMDNKGKNTVYHMGQRFLSLAEIKMISDCIGSSRSLSHKLTDKLIDKIESLASVHERELVHRQMFMSAKSKTDNEKIFYNVDSIFNAIARKVPIHFYYLEWSLGKKLIRKYDGKIYEVSPFSLIYDDDCYYMVAYDHGAKKIKHYRVDKMERIDLVKDQERIGEDFFAETDVEKYSKRHFGMYGGDSENVTLRCRNKLINVVMDRFGTEVDIEIVDDEWFQITVPVVVSSVFYGWVFQFTGNIVIVNPEHVKDTFRKMKQE